jgi:[ribosomal protein S5]-alanine N-acetyltransferase
MLTTSRCTLTTPQQQDYDDLRALYLNAQVRRYSGGPVEEQTFSSALAARLNPDTNPRYWVIRQTADDEFIGMVSLGLHHDGVSTEISYQLLPKWWRRGYATEAVQEVIRYAFEELKLPEIVAETQTANEASCRLLEKVGMQLQQTVERFGAEQAIFSIANPDANL